MKLRYDFKDRKRGSVLMRAQSEVEKLSVIWTIQFRSYAILQLATLTDGLYKTKELLWSFLLFFELSSRQLFAEKVSLSKNFCIY
jgi:hypothetical protein